MTLEERETVQLEVTKEAMEALITLLTIRDAHITELEKAHRYCIKDGFGWMRRWIAAYDKEHGTNLAPEIMGWIEQQPMTTG